MPEQRLTVSATGAGLTGVVHVPGDKSVSHRALVLAALTEGQSTLTGLPRGEDPAHTRCALSRFRVEFTDQDGGTVTGHGGLRHEPVNVLDCGNAGTGIRLLAGVCAGVDGTSVLTGDRYLRKRPMDRVAVPLRRMGTEVEVEGSTNTVRVRSGPWRSPWPRYPGWWTNCRSWPSPRSARRARA